METEKKSNGALVGIVIVVIILVIGGIYMWQINKNVTDNTNIEKGGVITTTDSVELDTLQKEIDTTDTNIDANTINSVQ